MNTVLVFVVIPVAVIGIVAALVLAGGDKGRRTPRYSPGRAYDFQPIWFLASPGQVTPALGGRSGNRAQPPALEAAVVEDSAGHRVLPGSTGGASDRW